MGQIQLSSFSNTMKNTYLSFCYLYLITETFDRRLKLNMISNSNIWPKDITDMLYVRGLPLITYALRARRGQVSYTLLLRIACKKGDRGSR